MYVAKLKKRYWTGIISLILFLYLLLFGPLFPWSPIKPSYQEFKGETYSVYYPEDTTLPEFYKELDSYFSTITTQFQLPLTKKIMLVRTTKSSFQRYLPWMNTEPVGGAALQTGDVLYISFEKIQERNLVEEEFVKHEVVHLMHHQNSLLFNSFKGMGVTYLSEGVAFYLGGPRYYAKDEFLERLKKTQLQETTTGNAIYDPNSFTQLDEQSGDRYKISHMLYGEFIGYLIKTYGQEKFNAFNKDFLADPDKHRTHFENHFGKKLEVVLQEFEEVLLKK